MNYRKIVSAVALLWCTAGFAAGSEPAACVRPMMGTGAAGCVVPVAAAPFGMVQLGPDTYFTASGYHYDHPLIYGFSHTHKSGGGGTDYQDIMFFPVTDAVWTQQQVCPDRVGSRYSHEQEFIEPGYYRIRLDSDVDAELTATARCGMHRYTYPEGAMRQLIIDLKHGCEHFRRRRFRYRQNLAAGMGRRPYGAGIPGFERLGAGTARLFLRRIFRADRFVPSFRS